jgi:hypothetical protein
MRVVPRSSRVEAVISGQNEAMNYGRVRPADSKKFQMKSSIRLTLPGDQESDLGWDCTRAQFEAEGEVSTARNEAKRECCRVVVVLVERNRRSSVPVKAKDLSRS